MSWGGGYVTDIAYAPGYYAEQSPRLMALTAMITGHAMTLPSPDEPFHFVDIGCGRGFTALVLAAANPGWTVTGLDFHPAHVASARSLAERAGVTNCRFVEADLTNYDAGELPDFDAVSMHGVWTWVAEPVRAGIVRLLGNKLRAGGLCHVSYNVQPAWHGMVGLQRLMREAGTRLAFRADRQAERGFDVVRRLVGAEGEQTDSETFKIIQACDDKPGAYMAHEFMNEAWQPCFHSDVVRALADAKLDYVGSPRLLENFPGLSLHETALEIAREFDDPEMLELIKDLTLGHPLRHDVYIRGATRPAPDVRDQALRTVALGLSVPYGQRKLEFQTASGRAAMNAPYYEPIFARLAEGPATVGDLLDLARPADRSPAADNPAELIAMLVGTRQAVTVAAPGAPMTPVAVALNAAMFAEKVEGGNVMQPVSLAVPALGGGYSIPGIGAFGVLRQHDWLNEVTIGQDLPRPSRVTFENWARLAIGEADNEQLGKIADAFEAFYRDHAAMLTALGLPC